MTSEPERNKELLQRAYARWHETKGGSVNDWLNIVDEKVSFGSLAEGRDMAPFTARANGKQQLAGFLSGIVSEWTMLHFTADHFIAEGDRVVMVGSMAWKSKKTGKTFESSKVDVWRLRDGKAIDYYEWYDTAALAQAAS